jgi:hypothetical protein
MSELGSPVTLTFPFGLESHFNLNAQTSHLLFATRNIFYLHRKVLGAQTMKPNHPQEKIFFWPTHPLTGKPISDQEKIKLLELRSHELFRMTRNQLNSPIGFSEVAQLLGLQPDDTRPSLGSMVDAALRDPAPSETVSHALGMISSGHPLTPLVWTESRLHDLLRQPASICSEAIRQHGSLLSVEQLKIGLMHDNVDVVLQTWRALDSHPCAQTELSKEDLFQAASHLIHFQFPSHLADNVADNEVHPLHALSIAAALCERRGLLTPHCLLLELSPLFSRNLFASVILNCGTEPLSSTFANQLLLKSVNLTQFRFRNWFEGPDTLRSEFFAPLLDRLIDTPTQEMVTIWQDSNFFSKKTMGLFLKKCEAQWLAQMASIDPSSMSQKTRSAL